MAGRGAPANLGTESVVTRRAHPVYQKDPNAAPDSDFSPGTIAFLVPGNRGRMLDPRRTPIEIVDVEPELAVFELEVTAFEDTGARWRLPFEDVVKFQFAHGSRRVGSETIAEYEEAVARHDRELSIPVDARSTAATVGLISDQVRHAERWLSRSSRFFAGHGAPSLPVEGRRGDPRLQSDLDRYLESLDLLDLERALAETYVSNPHSGEVLKGHRVVMAEIGLAAYDGKVVRDPSVLAGARDRSRRGRHIVARLGFVGRCSPGPGSRTSFSIAASASRAISPPATTGRSCRRRSAARSPRPGSTPTRAAAAS